VDECVARLVGTWRGHVLSRRQLVAGAAASFALQGTSACRETTPIEQYSLARWKQERGSRYLIGHRGAGDVVPEHTLESYRAALDWGAKALEISVVRSADGVLYCMHDLTLDRTTTLSGTVAKTPSQVIDGGRVDIPRLGPRWQGNNRPRIARVEDVLTDIGARAVLCMEAKDDEAFTHMVSVVEELKLMESVILKMDYRSARYAEAKEAGYPVFRYIGTVEEATPERVGEVAAGLDRTTDYLVVPSNENGRLLADEVIAAAVATGVPTWVFGTHRRSELAHHFGRGVVGSVTSSIGYVGEATPPMTETGWSQGSLPPGAMTRRPESSYYAVTWRETGVIGLAVQGQQAFVTLGQLAPLAQATGPYQVDVDVRVDRPPSGPQTNFTLAFAHANDAYYEHRQGVLGGYHAIIRMDGSLELWLHQAGRVEGTPLTSPASSPALVPGGWVPLRLSVTPNTLAWSRRDTGTTVQVRHAEHRGSYMHVGRSATDGALSVSDVRIS
jgi:hypothetical protein